MAGADVFLLSPARCDGRRAKMLMNPSATFDLAARLRSTGGAPIGEVFSFLSGLYFRGKLEYALTFAPDEALIRVITTNRGLMSHSNAVTVSDLESFSDVALAGADPRYLVPLRRDIVALAQQVPSDACVVLLGSIATGKYVDTLLECFGERLLFPADFVGRGDMSRGGLMLRHARSAEPLHYIPVSGAVRRGKRPPKLERLR